MKKYIPFILFFLVLFPDLTSQTVKIDGKVLDSQTRYPLSEAEVKNPPELITPDLSASSILPVN
jgi:hypothetical protein